MPVTFSPANHLANSFNIQNFTHYDPSPAGLLQGASYHLWRKCDEILQSSFESSHDPSEHIVPRKNGFVNTIVDAYSSHHALIIRPDDVWLAILSQFNFFVNGNAEVLRSQFVRHEGREPLVVATYGTRYTADFGRMAKQMTGLMQEQIVDPALREWILPDFSTTTDLDRIVGAITMMSTMKAYFSYEFHLMCGIPHVTLEGEKHDWEKILSKLEKLKQYGEQTTVWYHLLVPVISQFVQAFHRPNGPENIDFWQRVAHYHGGGSGPTYLSGWITAFCVFNAEGKWIGNPLNLVRSISNRRFR